MSNGPCSYSAVSERIVCGCASFFLQVQREVCRAAYKERVVRLECDDVCEAMSIRLRVMVRSRPRYGVPRSSPPPHSAYFAAT
jgi:hypothetical protein